MKKRNAILLFFLFNILIINAQKWSVIKDLNDEALLALYEYRYTQSAETYEKILKILPNSDNFKYLAAVAYFLAEENIPRAIELLEQAVQNIAKDGTYNQTSVKELRAPAEALYFLGRCYLVVNEWDKAINAFNSFIEKTFSDDELIPLVKHHIKNIPYMKNRIDFSSTIKIENLTELNTNRPNLFPVISGDGNTIAYCNPLDDGLNIFISTNNKGIWRQPENITWDIYAGAHRTAFISYDGKKLWLIDDNLPSTIVYTEFIDGAWTPVKKVGKPINSGYDQSSVALTRDGKTMYFTSNRPEGIGGFDIYVSKLNEKGKWEKPRNLGNIVNTEFNEEFVFLSPDEKTLYFSSEGHDNFGGADIFVWEIDSPNPPAHLEFPLNNAYNNKFYYPISQNQAVLSLNLPNGLGLMDIYKVTVFKGIPVIANLSFDPAISPNERMMIQINDSNGNLLKVIDPMPYQSIQNLGEFPFGTYSITIMGNGIEPFSKKFELTEQSSGVKYEIEANLKSLKPTVVAQVSKSEEPPKTESSLSPQQPEKPKATQTVPKEPQETPIKTSVNQSETKTTIQKSNTTKPETTNTKKEMPKPVIEAKPATIMEKLPEQPSKGKFTIQLMALEIPLTIKDIAAIGDLNIFYSPNGYFIYATGLYETREDAQPYLEQIQKSYPKAFITQIPVKGDYAIQLMALKNPKDLFDIGQTVEEISMIKGSDNLYRYFVAGFKTKTDAEKALPLIQQSGFPQAWIRKIPTE
ncbi:MAG TPA: SPOR domain-containing protein [Salinivirgaceae bacterium]|nr:SPOR domain-containing protein [Salinivirgaceae bacterium]